MYIIQYATTQHGRTQVDAGYGTRYCTPPDGVYIGVYVKAHAYQKPLRSRLATQTMLQLVAQSIYL